MPYYAFIQRDHQERCTVTFPDLPGLVVSRVSFRRPQKRLGPAERRHLVLKQALPVPLERLQALPRLEGDISGFWFEVHV